MVRRLLERLMRLIAVRSVKQIVRLGRGYDVGIFIWGLPAISTTGWLRKYDRRKHLYIPRKEATYVTLDGETSRLRTGLAMLWLPLLVRTGLVRLLPCVGKVPAFFPTQELPASTVPCLCLLPFFRGRTICVSIQERSLDPNIVVF